MTQKYITPEEAIEKYGLNNSKFRAALKKCAENGLYKAVYRERTKIHLREDFLLNWLKDNDVKSPCQPTNAGRPKNIPESPRTTNNRHSRNKGYW